MSKGFKRLMLMLMTMMLLLGIAVSANAATIPGQVTGVRATAGESKVDLKWSKFKGAKGYYIYRAAGNGALKRYKKVKGTKVSLKKQSNGTTYTFYVSAYTKKGETAMSAPVTATPMLAGLRAPVLTYNSAWSNYVNLKWNKISKASGYQIFSVEGGDYTYLGATKSNSFTVNSLDPETQYTFVVRTYRKVKKNTYYGAYSNLVTATTAKQGTIVSTGSIAEDGTLAGVHPYRWKGTITRTIQATSQTTGNTVTVPAGTKVTVTKRNSANASFAYNGQYYTTARNNVKLTGLEWKSGAYNDAVARQFVNQAGYTSPTGWLIWISTYAQRGFVFKGSAGNWVLQKSFQLSTGKFTTETRVGKTSILGKLMDWEFEGVVCAHYASRISSGAFHTWPYGGLGKPASHGCIRVPNSIAVYIYKNVPTKTTVQVF